MTIGLCGVCGKGLVIGCWANEQRGEVRTGAVCVLGAERGGLPMKMG